MWKRITILSLLLALVTISGHLLFHRGVIPFLYDINRLESLSDPFHEQISSNSLYLTPKQSPIPFQESYVLSSKGEPTNRDLIEKYFDREVWDYAEVIMHCESSGNEESYNNEYHKAGNCYGSFGLMQIACVHFGEYGFTWENRYDPETNIRVASEIVEDQGFSAFPNCP